jgi:hypothetical protein
MAGVRRRALWAAGLLTLLGAPSAEAAITIGQVAPPAFTPDTCGPSSGSYTQPTVTSGNSYVVPAAGEITSWSTRANGNASQLMALKIMRPLGANAYLVTTHDGPRPLAASSLNSFTTSLAVRAGDVLGVSTTGTGNIVACSFQVPGETIWGSFPEEPDDGEQATFFSSMNRRVNASAVFEPSNEFTLGKIRRNRKKGRATITVNLAGPGKVALAGKGVKRRQRSLATATGGLLKLTVIAKGKAANRLGDNGSVRVTPKVTFTPTGGAPATESRKLKLLLS